MRTPSIGEQELELLQYLNEQPSATVSGIAEGFGAQRRLARTTVHTMLERLRKKGYLTREKRAGVFHYTLRQPGTEVLATLVERFVRHTLGGSITPLAAYLAQATDLSPEELQELRAVVDILHAAQGGNTDASR